MEFRCIFQVYSGAPEAAEEPEAAGAAVEPPVELLEEPPPQPVRVAARVRAARMEARKRLFIVDLPYFFEFVPAGSVEPERAGEKSNLKL